MFWLRTYVLMCLDIDGFLCEAVEDGDIERVRYLLARRPCPRINSLDKYGKSALDLASTENHIVIMQLLVNLGRAALSTTALRYAAVGNNLEAITYLVGSSKDPLTYVNSLDKEKRTALHYAIRDGGYREKTVRHLIDLGADAALKDVNGWNPAHHACARRKVSLNVLKILIHSAAGSIGDQDRHGNTYLHIASRVNKSEYVEWLLANGADPSTKNTWHETAWEIAVENSSLDAIGCFSYEEVEYRARSDEYHVKNPSHQDAMIHVNIQYDLEWHSICGGNSVSRYLWQLVHCDFTDCGKSEIARICKSFTNLNQSS
jgi:ankyrin repeat protein